MRLGPLTPALEAARYGLSAKDWTPRVRAAFAALEQEIEALRAKAAELEGLADRDPLVPMLNRRAFLEALQRTASYTERYGGEAAVVYLDLDDFKAINDNFGHPTGDAALRHVGRLLLDHIRESDIAGRIGGDEFAVILVHTTLADAKRKAASLKTAIAATPLIHEGLRHDMSASIGVHAIARTEDAEAALARADEAMYANKKSARRIGAA